MSRLIGFELKKHFFTLPLLFVSMLFLFADGLKIRSVYEEGSRFSDKNLPQFQEAYEELYPQYAGKITEEKIENLLHIYTPIYEKTLVQTAGTGRDADSYTYNVYSDELFLRMCFLEELEYDYTYRTYADNLVRRAKENMEFYEKMGNTFGQKENYLLAKAFYQREITDFSNTERYHFLFYYDFSTLMILLILAYGCASVFVKEEETQMICLLKTAGKGDRASCAAKLLSGLLFAALVSMAFSAADYGFFACFFGKTSAGSSPIYAIEGFCNTYFRLTLDQGLLLFFCCRMLGMCVMGMLFMLASLLVKRITAAFLFNFAAVLLCFFGADYLEQLSPWLYFLPIRSGADLFAEAAFVRIGTNPVPEALWILAVSMAELLLLWGAGMVLWRKR